MTLEPRPVVADTSVNPVGVEKKVQEQREREEKGRFYPVPGKPIMIFVREGADPQKCIEHFFEKYKINHPSR